jgi:hypothetical protein
LSQVTSLGVLAAATAGAVDAGSGVVGRVMLGVVVLGSVVGRVMLGVAVAGSVVGRVMLGVVVLGRVMLGVMLGVVVVGSGRVVVLGVRGVGVGGGGSVSYPPEGGGGSVS